MALLSLIGRLGLDTSNFEGGLKKAESSASSFASSMTAKVGGALAGAFSVAAVTAMASKINETAIEVEHLAKQYSLTTDEVQKLQKATGKLGLEFDSAASALGRIEKARALVTSGGEQGLKALNLFSTLGVSPSDVVNPMKSSIDIMREIAAASEKGGRSPMAQKAEFELLGKNALQIKSIMVELKNLGPVKLIDADTINSAIESMKEVKRAKKEMMDEVLPLAGGLSRFASGFFGAINTMLGSDLHPAVKTFGLLGAVPVGLYEGSAYAAYGKPTTADPDPTGEKMNRVNKAMAQRLYYSSGGGYSFESQSGGSSASDLKKSATALEEIRRNTSKMLENFMPEGP